MKFKLLMVFICSIVSILYAQLADDTKSVSGHRTIFGSEFDAFTNALDFVDTNDLIYLYSLTNITEVVLTNNWSWDRIDDHNIRLLVNTNDFGGIESVDWGDIGGDPTNQADMMLLFYSKAGTGDMAQAQSDIGDLQTDKVDRVGDTNILDFTDADVRIGSTTDWWEAPIVQNTITIGVGGGAGPQYWPKDEHEQFLFTTASGGQGGPAALFSIAELIAAGEGGTVTPIASVSHPNNLGVNWFRGGAISHSLGRVLSGTALPGTAYPTNFASMPLDGTAWTSNNVARINNDQGINMDGMSFNNDSTKLFSNNYTDNRSNLYTWAVGDLTVDGVGLTLESVFTTSVIRVRNVRSFYIGGKDLVYYGEGQTGVRNPVYVYDTTTGVETQVLDEVCGNIQHVEVTGIGTDQLYLQVGYDKGYNIVYELSQDGKTVGDQLIRRWISSETIMDEHRWARVFVPMNDNKHAFFSPSPDAAYADRYVHTVSGSLVLDPVQVRIAQAVKHDWHHHRIIDIEDLEDALDDKLDVGADGTGTNLSDYNDDIGIITNAGVTNITGTDSSVVVDMTDPAQPDLSITNYVQTELGDYVRDDDEIDATRLIQSDSTNFWIEVLNGTGYVWRITETDVVTQIPNEIFVVSNSVDYNGPPGPWVYVSTNEVGISYDPDYVSDYEFENLTYVLETDTWLLYVGNSPDPGPALDAAWESTNLYLDLPKTLFAYYADAVGDVTINATNFHNVTNQVMVTNSFAILDMGSDALEAPYQAFTATYSSGATNTIVYADGPLVKITASEPLTIEFTLAGYPTNGVSRVGVELWAGTNSITFDTNTIYWADEPYISTNEWNSLFFRRVVDSIFKGRQ